MMLGANARSHIANDGGQNGARELVELLLAAGADANKCTTGTGVAPLHVAAQVRLCGMASVVALTF